MGALVVLRVLGLVLGGAVLILGLAGGGIYFLSTNRLNQKIEVPTPSIAIPIDITPIQRGQHLASAMAACAECHGPNLAGKVFIDDPLLARIVAPNLTRGRGGVGATRTDADFARGIREGVDPSGHQLLIMPSDDYNNFCDADLGAIIAYVRSLPAINTSLPASDVRTVGLLLYTLGQLPLQPAATSDRGAPRPIPPPPGVSAEYGQYLAANITPSGIGAWSEADFIKAMRTGIRSDRSAIDRSMPWPYFAQLTDNELRAIWRFLQVVPPRQTGTR